MSHPLDQLNKVRTIGELAEKNLSFLETPQRSLTVTFPLTMDDGSIRMIEGYRVQYNDALGPTKGGLRFHHDVNLEEATELAFLMALKCSLAGLPYGGGKGGLKINPKELSATELERVTRRFTREIAHFIGEDHDIPAPDVNTGSDTMRIMLDEYQKTVGKKSPATFTGKHIEDGGTLGRTEATGQGGALVIAEHYKNHDPQTIRVAIQGFGNVGSYTAKFLTELGFTIVAVSDSKTGIHNPDGLPIAELIEWKEADKSFTDRPEQKITNEELLELDVDLLIPSALGGVIHEINADKIKAQTIVEMANAPITPEADTILNQKGIVVIPDILANAGGVTVSYFEWLQNKQNEHWTLERVNDELRNVLVPAYQAVAEEATKNKTNFRTGSYLRAIKRIVEAEEKRK